MVSSLAFSISEKSYWNICTCIADRSGDRIWNCLLHITHFMPCTDAIGLVWQLPQYIIHAKNVQCTFVGCMHLPYPHPYIYSSCVYHAYHFMHTCIVFFSIFQCNNRCEHDWQVCRVISIRTRLFLVCGNVSNSNEKLLGWNKLHERKDRSHDFTRYSWYSKSVYP